MANSNADTAEGPYGALISAYRLGRRRPTSAGWLFKDLSVELARGERLALIGATGSGKTLLLRALALLDPLDEGELQWRGAAIDDEAVPAYRGSVHYLQQRSPLIEGTVEDNLRLPFSLRLRRALSFPGERAEELLACLGKDSDFLAASSQDLSGGERQMVGLVRALLAEPTVLLLDEPSAALDSETTSALEGMVDAWHDEDPTQRALIWVSHDAEQAVRVGRSTLRLRDGRLETG